jgi:hypothetical protein
VLKTVKISSMISFSVSVIRYGSGSNIRCRRTNLA